MRVLSSSLYKDTTFFREIQIVLTFEYISGNVKKTRFAAARVGLVLYYEAHAATRLSTARERDFADKGRPGDARIGPS